MLVVPAASLRILSFHKIEDMPLRSFNWPASTSIMVLLLVYTNNDPDMIALPECGKAGGQEQLEFKA